MFAIFNWALVIYAYIFIKEVCVFSCPLLLEQRANAIQTSGKSLEDMETVFNSQSTQITPANVEAAEEKVAVAEHKGLESSHVEASVKHL